MPTPLTAEEYFFLATLTQGITHKEEVFLQELEESERSQKQFLDHHEQSKEGEVKVKIIEMILVLRAQSATAKEKLKVLSQLRDHYPGMTSISIPLHKFYNDYAKRTKRVGRDIVTPHLNILTSSTEDHEKITALEALIHIYYTDKEYRVELTNILQAYKDRICSFTLEQQDYLRDLSAGMQGNEYIAILMDAFSTSHLKKESLDCLITHFGEDHSQSKQLKLLQQTLNQQLKASEERTLGDQKRQEKRTQRYLREVLNQEFIPIASFLAPKPLIFKELLHLKRTDKFNNQLIIGYNPIKTIIDQNRCIKACMLGEIEAVQLFSRQDIDINWVNHKGHSALHCASQTGQFTVVQFLVDQGARIDVSNASVDTPLHLACAAGYVDVAQYLLDHGADIMAKNEEGFTSLHYASYYGHLPIVQLLIERGAFLEAIDNNQVTPFYYARQQGHDLIVDFLLEQRASIDVTDDRGSNDLYYMLFVPKISR